MLSAEHVFTVSFFGHRMVSDTPVLEPRVERLISTLLAHHSHIDFLVGRNGDFDLMVTAIIQRLKSQIYGNACSLIWVLPYPTVELQSYLSDFEAYYDDIEVCQSAAQAHPKQAFQIRNREMIERSNLVVFYVAHSHGGAYQSLSYAKKRRKPLVNLASSE